jgi:hypothetical protein
MSCKETEMTHCHRHRNDLCRFRLVWRMRRVRWMRGGAQLAFHAERVARRGQEETKRLTGTLALPDGTMCTLAGDGFEGTCAWRAAGLLDAEGRPHVLLTSFGGAF